MTLALQHARQPPGGHHFTDPSGFVLRDKTLDGLLAAIATYRRNNGFHPGNPAAEVEARYAVLYPWLVTAAGTVPVVAPDPVALWVNRIWKSPPGKFVESETTAARMATCRICPHYQVKATFSVDATRRLLILGAGRFDAAAGTCGAHHWACGLAVLLEKPEVATNVGGCWAGI